MTYQIDPETEEKLQGLYEQVKGLNAFRLFQYACVVLKQKKDSLPRDSVRHHRLKPILEKLYDQISFRTKRRELDFRYTIEEYMDNNEGVCKSGLKAVVECIDDFNLIIPNDGSLEGRAVPQGR